MAIKLTEGIKKYTVNTGYLFLEKIARIIVTLTIWAIVVRYLGPEQYGIFSYAFSFVFLFSILSDLGLNDIIVRDLITNKQKEKLILGTALFLKLLGSISAILLIFISAYVFAIDHLSRILILIMSFRLFFQSFNHIDSYFQAEVMSKYSVYAKILSLVCTSILCLLFIHLKLPLIYFAIVVVAEAAVLALGLTIFYITQKKIFPWRCNIATAKDLLANSWPLALSIIAISIYMRIDQIMLKLMLDSASVGYYAAAVPISESFYFVPLAITGSLFPAIVKTKTKDNILYQNRIRALFSMLLWTGIAMAIFITLISRPLVNIVYGQQYYPTASVLSLHVWASVFVFLGAAESKWILAENLQIYLMFYMIIGAVLNILLNFILIPIWGINGAAATTVFSQFFVVVAANLISKKTRPIFRLQMESLNLVKSLRHNISY
ncbi:MAG: flippase [Candidatus Omnitrophica bacterium]|nr:flippase [Candidatus Omnitrophota bacterium]MDD5352368.1 flippase [Candidatus Omnitrophota bacterium]MDD5549966.1 flippase [Candidatus Omnitrophota bacterium]